MKSAVIDANVPISWVMQDEGLLPGSHRLRQAFFEGHVELIAPRLWEYEVANALVSAVAGRRISEEEARIAEDYIRNLEIAQHNLENRDVAWDLAVRYGLTFYDASYLALAESQGCECLTGDRKLVNAAAASGLVRWVGDYE